VFIQRSQRVMKIEDPHELIGMNVDPEGFEKHFVNDVIGKLMFL